MRRIRRALLGGELEQEVLESAERAGFVRIDDPLTGFTSRWRTSASW